MGSPVEYEESVADWEILSSWPYYENLAFASLFLYCSLTLTFVFFYVVEREKNIYRNLFKARTEKLIAFIAYF